MTRSPIELFWTAKNNENKLVGDFSRLTQRDMDDDNLVIISWQDFESSSPEIIRNLWKDEDFSDVTLATDDGQIVRAHRVVLCSASSKLKKLLIAHKHDNPIVYLPDIDSGHLVNLVKFIYQGKCQIREEILEEFLNCGKSLGLENLTEYFRNKGNETLIQDQTKNPSKEKQKVRRMKILQKTVKL